MGQTLTQSKRNQLTGLKILTRKNAKQQVLFHFSKSTDSIKIYYIKLVCIEIGSIKNCLAINLWSKIEHLATNFVYAKLSDYNVYSMI